MVVAKDAALVPAYDHPDLLLTTNDQVQDYRAFTSGHQKVYATAKQYSVPTTTKRGWNQPTGWPAGCGSPPNVRVNRRLGWRSFHGNISRGPNQPVAGIDLAGLVDVRGIRELGLNSPHPALVVK